MGKNRPNDQFKKNKINDNNLDRIFYLDKITILNYLYLIES